MPRSPYPTLWHRLMANTAEPAGSTDCWPWAAKLDREGYGQFNLWVPGLGTTATLKAHIAVHVLLNVGVDAHPDVVYLAYQEHSASGLELDHTCTDRWCCNPDHLELVTGSENCKRRDTRRVSPR